LNRIALAFRAFFDLLFSGKLPDDLTRELGLVTKPITPSKPATAPPPKINATDGALQLLGILQRDARLLDFFLEDIGPYSDEQVGAAARGVHTQVKEAFDRYFEFAPIIDGVEGSFTQAPSKDQSRIKFIGNVPATPPAGGILRHRGWLVTKVDFPALPSGQNLKVLAPAELEVE
jgi:hypothetical protein